MDALTFSRRAREHLERSEAALQELLDCLRREREALTALDGPGAARIALEKESIVRREAALTDERRAIVAAGADLLRARCDGAAVDLSLGEVVLRLRPPGGSTLLKLRSRVRTLSGEAQRSNALNRQLCAHALACVRGYLALAGHTTSETYGRAGRVVAGGGASAYARRM